ncbi:hypothetical protein K458DRAFT_304897 [Lentithecium fluviatile CBS 122367]|uniref:Vacuolar import and degradation protein 21 n=1 Tax=Lentithecium fluviatile CBS 122367 TaxID=1168545 RepID=A0A6G1IZM0_9PLEO|nr:hypothetical protein K458DRAFT_304897 [Lentithecium fluviatile CBS 122367]
MSLDGLRDAFSREKKNEIALCEQSRKRKLRELYHYTALLNLGHPPQVHDWVISDEPSEHEARFLDENDITKGRRFNDATVPFPDITQFPLLPPTLPFQTPAKPAFPAFTKTSPAPAGPSLEEQLRAASASPSVASQLLPSIENPVPSDTASVAKQTSTSPRADASLQAVPPAVDDQAAIRSPAATQQPGNDQPSDAPAIQELRKEEALPDGPSVDPKNAIPPSSEDVTAPLDGLVPVERSDEPQAPQVVHLPPKEVQEARLQETERKLEKAAERERKEDERLGLPSANGTTDLASSPSSTVGPYSQATPRAPHHSPDTSPDTESFRDDLPPQTQSDADVETNVQTAKDDHERALQEQMRQARERARGDSDATDDVEKQLEDEQAIRLARDGKGRLSESESAPAAGTQALTDHAAEIEREVQAEATSKPIQEPAADSLPTPTTIAQEPSATEIEALENDAAASQQPPRMGPEHPTPPAEVDVEMDDAPLPVKNQPEAAPQPQSQPSPARMITRVSSGAIRQKSVSEILGDNGERSAPKSVLTPRSSNPSASASPARPSHEHKRKEVSTVIFAKPDVVRPTKALQLYNEDYASLQGASQDSGRDYLQGLFQYQAHHPPRSVVLQDLVASARKTLSTAGTLAMVREQQDYKILKRVYQLQNANRWSLRQLQKSAEPERPVTHQDHLLAEMKWMQTDFKEERKWKRGLAATFADWCAQYVNSSPEERASLRIRARVPKTAQTTSTADEDMNDAPTPDLIHSGPNETESESFADDDELLSPLAANAPAGLFSLGFNDVVMKIHRTPASDAILRELPLYEPVLEGASDVSPLSFVDPPILPVSKFVIGKLVSQVRGPPRKRSRYEYDSEDEPSTPPSRSGTSAEHSMPSTPGRRLFHRNDLPPEMADVALFNPENRHIRDRLQAAHQFRPPTEFPMPSVSFFENRSSSQWLWEEDQKLRALVKEYTFNWSLVAQQLALPSLYVSGSGRRTPWECFERWVQLEGLPAEMSKTQYFRTYQSRLEQAQRTVLAQHQAQQQLLQQQAQNGQSISGQPRRRTSQPIRVERRRENRHLAIIDGMRKLARKRESLAHKQAESQKAAALRKAHEPAQPKGNNHTPQEVSRLKWEREEKMKQKQLLMQQEMHARQLAAQRQAQMQAAQSGMANGVNPQQRNGTPGTAANVSAQLAATSQQGHNSTVANAAMAARTQQTQQAMQANFSNGNVTGISMGSTGVPQAQMQANMQNNQRMPPPDQQVRMAMQQRGPFTNTNQQHQFQLQQQQINMASNLTQNLGINGMPNANMIASMAGQNMNSMNGTMNGSMNAMSNNAGSPRMNQANMQSPARPLSSGHMPQLLQLQNHLKVQHPEWSPEQVQKTASTQLSQFLTKQRSQAMSAASGSSGLNQSPQIGNNMHLSNGTMSNATMSSGTLGVNSPSPNAVYNYQQQLVRQQAMMSQQQRQQAGSPGMNARPPSRSATPQGAQLLQSPGLQQAQVNRS